MSHYQYLGAENNAVGGTLEQRIDGRPRVIAYAGKRLSPAQRSYSPTKGELAGVLIILGQIHPDLYFNDH